MPLKPKSGETRDEFISRCIATEISAGYDNPQAAGICYSKWREEKMKKANYNSKVASRLATITKFSGVNLNFAGEINMEEPCWDGYEQYGTKMLDGREVPNCIPVEAKKVEMAEELNVLGYRTKAFHICPGAVATFKHLMEMELDEDTVGMVRSAAQIADNVFKIEKRVLDAGVASSEDLDEAIILVADFKDLMEEIDEETGMVHNVDYMDGHINKISELVK